MVADDAASLLSMREEDVDDDDDDAVNLTTLPYLPLLWTTKHHPKKEMTAAVSRPPYPVSV